MYAIHIIYIIMQMQIPDAEALYSPSRYRISISLVETITSLTDRKKACFKIDYYKIQCILTVLTFEDSAKFNNINIMDRVGQLAASPCIKE